MIVLQRNIAPVWPVNVVAFEVNQISLQERTGYFKIFMTIQQANDS